VENLMNRLFAGLWRHPDFMKLWAGQTISEFGSRITRDGLPLIAILVLAASPAQMGILTAAASLPVLLFGLFAGVWVDRLRRRPIMIAADLTRVALLLTIPIATLTGHLSFEMVVIVAAAAALLGLIFDTAYRAYLPALVEREHLLESNTKLATTDSLAEIGGPAIAGLLIQWMSAPLAIFWDAVSFLFSAASFALIRKPEPVPAPPETRESAWREVVEGFGIVYRDPALRTLLISMGLRSFFGNFYGVLYGLYAVRDLGLTPAALGAVVSAGGIGALMGAFASGIVGRRLGMGRTLGAALLVSSLISVLTPLAGGSALTAMIMLIIPQIIGDAAMMVFGIHEMSLRQMIVPERALGRANATFGFVAEVLTPLGALTAGILATLIGARLTLGIAVLGGMITAVYVARTFGLRESAVSVEVSR
jgi:MFS family permease